MLFYYHNITMYLNFYVLAPTHEIIDFTIKLELIIIINYVQENKV